MHDDDFQPRASVTRPLGPSSAGVAHPPSAEQARPQAGVSQADLARLANALDSKHIDRVLAAAEEQRVRRGNGEEQPIPGAWDPLNERLGGGFWPGFYVLTGPTGAGKTQFVLAQLLAAAQRGHPTVYVSLEMDQAQVVARLQGMLSGDSKDPAIPWSAIWRGESIGAPDRLERATRKLQGLPLYIVEGTPKRWNTDDLRNLWRGLEVLHPDCGRGKKPWFCAVDYVQLMGSSAGSTDTRERIADACLATKDLARETGAVILAVSSIARQHYFTSQQGVDTDYGKGPTDHLVGQGKETGEIEYAADGVFALVREPAKGPGRGQLWLALAKIRYQDGDEAMSDGRPRRWLALTFDRGTMKAGGNETAPPAGHDRQPVPRKGDKKGKAR